MDTLVVLQRPLKAAAAARDGAAPRGRLRKSDSLPLKEFRPKISFVKLYHEACEQNKRGDTSRRQVQSARGGGEGGQRFVRGDDMFSESADSVLKAYLLQGSGGAGTRTEHALTADLLHEITYDEQLY